MDLIITILPVVTKDLPISPRFTPYNLYRGASSALLQLVNKWSNFTYIHTSIVLHSSICMRPDSHTQSPNNCIRIFVGFWFSSFFLVSVEMLLFPSIFVPLPFFSLYGRPGSSEVTS